MITIDGSQGEGGGQILRSSLALAMVTGRSCCLQKIRAGRKKPGLMRQHLTAVRAAVEVCGASVEGDEIGSKQITFEPGKVKGGAYTFSVGTAGSATLVLQTVLPALLLTDEPSTLTLEGGTHNPFAPPFDFLAKTFLPLVNRMGPRVTTTLEKHGFYPAGGGRFTVSIQPAGQLNPFELIERGEVVRRSARALVANLSEKIAERELTTIHKKLNWPDDCLHVEVVPDSPGPGNVIMLEVESENICEVFTGFGELNRTSEQVAGHAVQKCREYLAKGVPVGEYLADQLLLPMAIAGSGAFRTVRLTRHTRTHIDLIHQFLDCHVTCDEQGQEGVEVSVG